MVRSPDRFRVKCLNEDGIYLLRNGSCCVRVLQSEPCGGDDLRGDAAVLGMAAGAVGWLGVGHGVGCCIDGDAVADGIAGGWCRGGGVVVDLATGGGGLVETALPTLDAVDCIGVGWDGLVVDVATAHA